MGKSTINDYKWLFSIAFCMFTRPGAQLLFASTSSHPIPAKPQPLLPRPPDLALGTAGRSCRRSSGFATARRGEYLPGLPVRKTAWHFSSKDRDKNPQCLRFQVDINWIPWILSI
jgi:hypothetical protein